MENPRDFRHIKEPSLNVLEMARKLSQQQPLNNAIEEPFYMINPELEISRCFIDFKKIAYELSDLTKVLNTRLKPILHQSQPCPETNDCLSIDTEFGREFREIICNIMNSKNQLYDIIQRLSL